MKKNISIKSAKTSYASKLIKVLLHSWVPLAKSERSPNAIVVTQPLRVITIYFGAKCLIECRHAVVTHITFNMRDGWAAAA